MKTLNTIKKVTTENGTESVLKEGHDFPTDLVSNGMDYDVFVSIILSKIGNLRLYYKDQNSKRSNEAIELKDYSGYNEYAKISSRGDLVVDTLIDHLVSLTKVDLTKLHIPLKLSEDSLPKIKDLIDANMITVGDELVITINLMNRKQL